MHGDGDREGVGVEGGGGGTEGYVFICMASVCSVCLTNQINQYFILCLFTSR